MTILEEIEQKLGEKAEDIIVYTHFGPHLQTKENIGNTVEESDDRHLDIVVYSKNWELYKSYWNSEWREKPRRPRSKTRSELEKYVQEW